MTEAISARPKVFSATPVLFDREGEVHIDEVHRLHAGLATAGLDGMFVAGTTGEFLALDDNERLRVFETAAHAAGPEAVIGHVGAASGRQAVRLTRSARRLGLRRLAAITPFYLRAEPEQILRYYAEIAEAAEGAELFVYAFEAVTNNPVPAELLAELAKLPGISGVKLSGVQGTELISAYAAATPDGFTVLSGNDRDLADVVRAGGSGVVSGVSAALPEPFVRLAEAVLSGDAEAERHAQRRVDEAVGAIGANIAALKSALGVRGFPESCRMPIASPAESQRARIRELMENP
ncbi:MAG: dihydrodipicolinate synthase family protein [Pseudonocardiaceae bacterium]|nr:dihydrodipicolinate synthase family protein [Pseudonocardiaceae bacterium]